MAAPKLIQLLSTFTKEDWFSLKKTVLSNITEHSDTYRIFKLIFERKNDLSDFEDINHVITKHFKELNSKTFLNHMSTLYQITESWMVKEQLISEPKTFHLLLHRNLQKRGMYNQANQLSNQLQKEWINEKGLSALWAKKEILHQEFYSFNPIKYEKGTMAFSQLMDATYEYIQHLLSVYQVELVNFGKIQKHDFHFEEEKSLKVLQLLQVSEGSSFFGKMYELIKFDKTEWLEELKYELIHGKWPKGSLEEVISTIYLIRKTSELYERGSQLPTVQIITELFTFAMNQGVYTEHGKLAPVTFRNIIGQLSRYQSFEFIKDFINEWYIRIASPHAESTRNVSHAINCLKHEKYDEIFYHTRQKHYTDENEKAISYLLHLIACFMDKKNDYNLYSTTLHNYSTFLTRHKNTFSTKFFKGLWNTIDIMKKLDHDDKVDLSSYETIFYREWCERMVEKRGN